MKPAEIRAAQERIEIAREALKIEPPESNAIIGPDGGPHIHLMRWTKKHGISLDFIFRGDLHPLIIGSARYRQAQS